MSPALQVALAVGPLAAYFAALGALQGGRRPVVVPGPIDFLLLATGLGGLIVFGPVGLVLVRSLFPAPSPWAWLALASAYGLFVLLWAPRGARRLVVYHVDPESLRTAVREALMVLPGAFTPTVRGFEDREHGRGLTVEAGARLRAGTVEAYGDRSEPLIAELAPLLRARLRRQAPPVPGRLALLWFGLSALTLLLPVAAQVLGRPQVMEALRALMDRLRGG